VGRGAWGGCCCCCGVPELKAAGVERLLGGALGGLGACVCVCVCVCACVCVFVFVYVGLGPVRVVCGSSFRWCRGMCDDEKVVTRDGEGMGRSLYIC